MSSKKWLGESDWENLQFCIYNIYGRLELVCKFAKREGTCFLEGVVRGRS